MNVSIKLAIRNILKSKSSTFTSLFGLTIGFVALILIAIWVVNELSYNHSFSKLEQIHIVLSRTKGDMVYRPISPFPIPNEIAYKAFPEIEYYSSSVNLDNCKLSVDERTFRSNGLSVTLPFFRIFDIEFQNGGIKGINDSSKVIFITERLANKLFGSVDVIGKSVDFIFQKNRHLTVIGVIKNPPINSSFKYEFLVPYLVETSWGRMPIDFIQVLKNTEISKFNQRFNTVGGAGHYYGADGLIEMESAAFPLSELYFNSNFTGYEHGNMNYVWIMVITGIIILFATLLNFVNLASSRLLNRFKDIGIRKILGSQNQDFYSEFIFESLIFFSGSIVIAISLVLLLFPSFQQTIEREISIQNTHLLSLFSLLIIIGLVSSFLCGLILPILLRNDSPVSMTKGTLRKNVFSSFKEKLMIAQLSVSIVGLSLSLLVGKQLRFMINSKPGYEIENIIKVNLLGSDFDHQSIQVRDAQLSYIEANLTSTSLILDYDRGDFPTTSTLFPWKVTSDLPTSDINTMSVGKNFFNLFGLKILEGDALRDSGPLAVLNESAIRAFRIDNPIGHKIENASWGKFTVLGVVKDFNFESTGISVKPLIIVCQPYLDRPLIVKVAKGKTEDALDYLAKMNSKINPGLDFQYQFMDQEFENLFRGDQTISTIFNGASLVSLSISLMGLFSFMLIFAQERTKEVGIRKVFGASALQIALLFSNYFGRRFLFAFIIAAVASTFLSSKFLEGFSNKIGIDYLLILYAGIMVSMLSFITIAYQTVSSANANPVNSLRNE
ncbi:MAG: ABC transporter permease [Cyclobacteriaceae bacterium]